MWNGQVTVFERSYGRIDFDRPSWLLEFTIGKENGPIKRQSVEARWCHGGNGIKNLEVRRI